MPVGVQCPISSSLGEFPATGIGSTHCHRPVLLSQSHTGIFTPLHSPFIITIPSIQSQYSFRSSPLWRCRNQSRSKLPLLSSPTQVLEQNIYSLLSISGIC